jgi:hypothetical protein
MTILITSNLETYHIDPAHANDIIEDGSMAHPFNSWLDVPWKEGKTYLQKSGTTAYLTNLNIETSNVTLGKYGDGTSPKIVFSTDDYGLRIYNLQNIRIENLFSLQCCRVYISWARIMTIILSPGAISRM